MTGRTWKWTKLKNKILERDNYTCARCGHKRVGYYIDKNNFKRYESDVIVDHIVPIKLDGAEFDSSNLQVLCVDCNREKNRWDQHFIAKVKREIKNG
jgi:5-methylcytosine-specific restriction endonuclease McrA